MTETERLHQFTLLLAERLFLAAEVLAMRAERKTKKATASCDGWLMRAMARQARSSGHSCTTRHP